MVFNKPIETTQRLGQSNGATVNPASGARRVQDERQCCSQANYRSLLRERCVIQPDSEGAMKNSIKCPVCGRDFDPRTPVCHISRYHQAAKNCELEKIRDARRQHFNQAESGSR